MRRDGAVDPVVTSLLVLTLDPVVIPLLVLTLDPVVTPLFVLILVAAAWPGAKPDAPGRPLMASLCFFGWPGAYAEAPFDTLPLLCIICPGAVGCCAMAGALTNAAKVPITARHLIIGHSFLCAPSITPAESQGFPPPAVQGAAGAMADSVPVAMAVSFPLWFQSRAPNRQGGIN
jgi:hypothetical protein